MTERKFKKQLIVVTAAVMTATAVLCAVTVGMWNYLYKKAHEAEHSQMASEAQEYKQQISEQMDTTIQILTTLAKAYEVSGVTDRREELELSISEANAANTFRSLAYMPIEGVGILNTQNIKADTDYRLENCNPYAVEAIEKAFKGENSVSKIFTSENEDVKIFLYCVPVRSNGEIIGALVASDDIKIFNDIVENTTVIGGKGYIHIINSDGTFLARSKKTIVKENINNIFDGPYLSGSTRTVTEEALKQGKSSIGEFEYKGMSCHFYIEPLGLNSWYLFCANQVWGSNVSWRNTVWTTGIIMLVILVMLLFVMFFGYFSFYKNTRYLIKDLTYDSITGAKKVYSFDRALNEYKSMNSDYSIVALNIHNFKFINVLFGTKGGDDVLRYVKRVIEENLGDEEFFCRDTADLFYLLMVESDEEILKSRIGKIIDRIRNETRNAKYSYEISLYAGLAIRGTKQKALLALKSLKNIGYSNIAVYDNKLREILSRNNDIERYMHRALAEKEFKMYLQPKFDLKTGEITGAEALVRWERKDGTLMRPDEFVPLFENNGFCTEFDMYMIAQACCQIREWEDSGYKPVPISVNQSRRLFFNRKYADDLEKILRDYNVEPSMITLEILETVADSGTEEISARIKELHEKGFKISMDDFGSGYSSLNMLYKLNVDELKIDRGFLRDAGKNNYRRDILLEQIIMTSRRLGISTVAEGIETKRDNDMMLKMKCDYGQGYYYSRPISADEFSEKYIRKA